MCVARSKKEGRMSPTKSTQKDEAERYARGAIGDYRSSNGQTPFFYKEAICAIKFVVTFGSKT